MTRREKDYLTETEADFSALRPDFENGPSGPFFVSGPTPVVSRSTEELSLVRPSFLGTLKRHRTASDPVAAPHSGSEQSPFQET
jgi:hypothetical protein